MCTKLYMVSSRFLELNGKCPELSGEHITGTVYSGGQVSKWHFFMSAQFWLVLKLLCKSLALQSWKQLELELGVETYRRQEVEGTR